MRRRSKHRTGLRLALLGVLTMLATFGGTTSAGAATANGSEPVRAARFVTAPAAAGASSQADDVGTLTGCAWYRPCGTVANNTTRKVLVCKAWSGNGSNHTYQTSGKCKDKVYVNPHKIYGKPQNVDVDAIYIPAGRKYVGAYGPTGTQFPKVWKHRGNGWWKFASITTVAVTYTL